MDFSIERIRTMAKKKKTKKGLWTAAFLLLLPMLGYTQSAPQDVSELREYDSQLPIQAQSGWIYSCSHTVASSTTEWVNVSPASYKSFSIEVSSATGQVTGSLGNISIEVLGSNQTVKTDNNQIGLPIFFLERVNDGNTYTWVQVPNITAYGVFSIPIYGINFLQLRITNSVAADSIERTYRMMAR